jgi:hypothetical protein
MSFPTAVFSPMHIALIVPGSAAGEDEENKKRDRIPEEGRANECDVICDRPPEDVRFNRKMRPKEVDATYV